MARIPLVDVEDMTPEQREQYDRFPSNLARALLLMDSRMARVFPEAANALRASQLEPSLREAVILRVAFLCDSAYERMQHLEQAKKVGWSDEQIAAIEAGVREALPDDLRQVLAFVDDCVATTRVSDAAFSAARDVLSDRDLATLIALIGHYMTIARLTGTLEVELDAEPDPFLNEH